LKIQKNEENGNGDASPIRGRLAQMPQKARKYFQHLSPNSQTESYLRTISCQRSKGKSNQQEGLERKNSVVILAAITCLRSMQTVLTRVLLFSLLLLSAFAFSGCVATAATQNMAFHVSEKKQFWITAIYEDSAPWMYDENTSSGRKFALAGYFDGAKEKSVFLMLDYATLKQAKQREPVEALRDIEKEGLNVTISDKLPQNYTLVASRNESQENGVAVNLATRRVSMKYLGTLLWSVPLDIVTLPVQAGVMVFGRENMVTAGKIVVAVPLIFLFWAL
jgi:hypothetical protein